MNDIQEIRGRIENEIANLRDYLLDLQNRCPHETVTRRWWDCRCEDCGKEWQDEGALMPMLKERV